MKKIEESVLLSFALSLKDTHILSLSHTHTHKHTHFYEVFAKNMQGLRKKSFP